MWKNSNRLCVSNTLICYVDHTEKRLHCLSLGNPETAQEHLSKPPCSPDWEVRPASSERDDHSPPPSRDFCLTASDISVLDIWFSKVIFPKLKDKQTAKVRAPVGWRSVLTSNVSSFSIRTNLRVIKGQNLSILKMWGQEM